MAEENRSIKQGFTEKKVPEDLDVIIIGSGMSGMACAVSLAKAGFKVLVLEQHDVVGGNTHTFNEKGFEFDTGLHYIGAKVGKKGSQGRKQWDYFTGGRLDWKQMDDAYDVAVVGDEHFEMTTGMRQMVKKLKDEFPDEGAAIDKHFKLVRDVNKYAVPAWVSGFFAPKFIAGGIQAVVDKFFTGGVQNLTTQAVLDKLTDNKKLKQILSYHYGDYGETPDRGSFLMHCLLWGHYAGGAFYPVGGPTAIALNFVEELESLGGKCLVRANVETLIMDPTSTNTVIGVEVKKGTKTVQVFAPKVISTIGAPKTFTTLVPASHTPLFQAAIDWMARKNVRSDMTLMSLFVGMEGTAEELGLSAKNYWIFPSWDHRENYEKYKEDPTYLTAAFASFSSVKDPTYKDRCPNKQVALVVGPCNYDVVAEWKDNRVKKRGPEYEEIKEKLKASLLSAFIKQFPHLEDKIKYVDLGTALSNDYYLGTYRGSVYGLGHTPERFKGGAEHLSITTPLNGFYMSGQDVLSCGIMGAMAAGYMTAMTISWKARMNLAPLFV